MAQSIPTDSPNLPWNNRSVYAIAFGLFLLSILFFCKEAILDVFAAGNTYYVSTTGNDSNSGTANSPFRTFQKAISLLRPGDALTIFGGTYNERISVPTSINGDSAAAIVIQPVSGQHVVIDMQNTSVPAVSISGSYITLAGIEARNSNSICMKLDGQYINVSRVSVHHCYDHGVQVTGKHVIFSDSSIYMASLSNTARVTTSGWQSGFKVRVGEYVTAERNTIYNNYGEGFGLRGKHITVRNNRVYDNYSVNIYSDNSTDVTIESNIAYCTNNELFFRDGRCAINLALAEEYFDGWGSNLIDNKIYNNILAFGYRNFVYNGFESGVLEGGLKGAKIYNNTLWGSAERGMIIQDAPYNRDIYIYNNIVQQSSGKLADFKSTRGIVTDYNFWVGSPSVLVNAAGLHDKRGDVKLLGTPNYLHSESFQLSSTSPAINVGFNRPEVLTDYAGIVRDSTIDMGVWEYRGGSIEPTTMPPVETVTQTPMQTPDSSIICPPGGVIARGVATLTVDLAQAGNYKVWVQMMGKGDTANTLWLQMDNLYCSKVGDMAGMPSHAWEWVDYENGNATDSIPMPILASGTHTIKIMGNASESGVSVDKILLTRDSSCVPTGNGDTCVGLVSTMTPTNTSTVTPTSVIVATSTPVPTAVPISNSTPTITTTALPRGRRITAYSGRIDASDGTLNDSLRVTASQLPPGVVVGTCSLISGFGGTSVSCPLVGIPTQKGTFNTSFTVVDGTGNSVTKMLKIQIIN